MTLLWLAILAATQLMSLWPDPSPCLAEIDGYRKGHQDYEKGCAPLHVLLVWAIGKVGVWIEANDKGIVAAATLVISVFTVTLWWTTRNLWQAGERQMALIASNAAQQSRDTEASIAIAREAMVLSQRAWVTVEIGAKTMVDPPTKRSHGMRISVEARNIGNSPTSNMRSQFNVAEVDVAFPADFTVGDIPNVGTKSLFLAPRGSAELGAFDAPWLVLGRVMTEGKFLYAWGWLEFDDGFPETPRHRLEYCYGVKVEGDPTLNLFTLSFYHHGTTANRQRDIERPDAN